MANDERKIRHPLKPVQSVDILPPGGLQQKHAHKELDYATRLNDKQKASAGDIVTDRGHYPVSGGLC